MHPEPRGCANCGKSPADGQSLLCSGCLSPERQRENAYRRRPDIAKRIKDDAHRRRDSRRGHLRALGLTLDDFERMVTDRDGKCDICGRSFGEDLQVDHDHADGRVRGLLCSSCNTGIGALGDTAVSLRRAYEYLAGARPPGGEIIYQETPSPAPAHVSAAARRWPGGRSPQSCSLSSRPSPPQP